MSNLQLFTEPGGDGGGSGEGNGAGAGADPETVTQQCHLMIS